MEQLTEVPRDGEVVGEIVAEVALVPKPATMRDMVKSNDLPLLDVMETMNSLNWRDLKPHQTALLIMQKPFQSGGGQMYLSFRQAILFATRAYELGLSPFSSELWFDSNRASVNLTLEGKRQLLRNRGIDVGPPSFEMLSREWKDVPRITDAGEAAKKAGFIRDIGCKCTIRVGDPKNAETVNYTAFLNEWYVEKSPVWKTKAEHMLTIRANEKAVTLILGTGASDMVGGEQD